MRCFVHLFVLADMSLYFYPYVGCHGVSSVVTSLCSQYDPSPFSPAFSYPCVLLFMFRASCCS